ncbi:SPFH domain-containing protein [Candidatus Harpocratesius sp.]
MIFQNESGVIITVIIIILILLSVIGLIILKGNTVVPFNETHVVSKGKRVATYDGKGRYVFIRFFMSRTIIPKHVLDIEPKLIKLHDQDNLPFGVEISVKVQVTDPQKASATLTRIDHSTVAKVVEDTVMSAARSVAMERTILDVMKKREEIEQAIYMMVSDALGKLGLSAIIFDIKNIRDVEGADVIENLERVKIAELRKNARISESIHNNEAIVVEVEKSKEAKVKTEQMLQEQEAARLEREQMVAARQKAVEQEKLEIEMQRIRMQAEAQKQQKLINAQSEAEAIAVRAKAEAEAIKIKAEAEAESIRARGEAEANVLKQKAIAMKDGNFAAQIEMMKILSVAQVDTAEKVAQALGKNNKIMYIPMTEEGNILSNFLPKMDAIMQSGLPTELLSTLKNTKKETKKKS